MSDAICEALSGGCLFYMYLHFRLVFTITNAKIIIINEINKTFSFSLLLFHKDFISLPHNSITNVKIEATRLSQHQFPRVKSYQKSIDNISSLSFMFG